MRPEEILPPAARSWIEKATNARVVSVTPMTGATTNVLHALSVEQGSKTLSLVLRLFTDDAWVKREPDLAIREAESTAKANAAGLRVPELIAVDSDGSYCGVPATLVTRLDGEVVLAPPNMSAWLEELARAAAAIHEVPANGFRWQYRRYNESETLAVPKWTTEPRAWATAIELASASMRPYRASFIHRDYHPNNVLWSSGQLSGVVDWVNGCAGPPGIDVAWCRHNLANLYSVEIADEFLNAYLEFADARFVYDSYWDLMTVVELLPGPPAMYDGWRAIRFPAIDDATMRMRVDRYIASLIARL